MTKRERLYHRESFPNSVMDNNGFYVSKFRGNKKKWAKDLLDKFGSENIIQPRVPFAINYKALPTISPEQMMGILNRQPNQIRNLHETEPR